MAAATAWRGVSRSLRRAAWRPGALEVFRTFLWVRHPNPGDVYRPSRLNYGPAAELGSPRLLHLGLLHLGAIAPCRGRRSRGRSATAISAAPAADTSHPRP